MAPVTKITIDFETRSECDLKAAGAWNYSKHPTTEVLCFAFKVDDNPINSRNPKSQTDRYACKVDDNPSNPYNPGALMFWPYPFDFRGDFQFEAHNAGFEFAIWHNVMVPQHGWPDMPLEHWYCSAAKAAAHGLPRNLSGATEAMDLSEIKDKKGHSLMLKLCKPRPMWKKKGTGDKYFGTPEEFRLLEKYCRQDVRAEHELSSALDDLSPFERRIWKLDQQINRRGINCDLPLVNAAIALAGEDKKRGKAVMTEATNGEVTSPNQIAKIREYLGDHYLYDIPDLGALTVQTCLDDPEAPAGAKRILRLRQLHSKSSVRKYQTMLGRADPEGAITETLLYHGAHTGRWAGMAIQPHNYPKPSLSRGEIESIIIPAILEQDADSLELYCGSVGEALSSALRSALVAPPGHDLIGADYSNIEARVLFWFAGDTQALETLRSGGDLYVEMASAIYGIPPRDVTKEQRDIGKKAILGLGYQMAAKRFRESNREQGVEVSKALSERAVDTYREEHSGVPDFWKAVNRRAIQVVKDSRHRSLQLGQLVFGYKSPFFYIELPSGRRLTYAFPKLQLNRFKKVALSHMHIDPYTKKWERTTTYGGALTENIVQGTARDIMAHAMLKVEASEIDYKLRMSVHDELVATVPERRGSVRDFESLLCDTPAWADGCPIAAEGWRGKRYRK